MAQHGMVDWLPLPEARFTVAVAFSSQLCGSLAQAHIKKEHFTERPLAKRLVIQRTLPPSPKTNGYDFIK